MHSEPSVALVLEHWAPGGDDNDYCGHDDQHQEEGDDITMVVMAFTLTRCREGWRCEPWSMVMVMITKHQDESDVQDVTCKHQACVTSSPHVRYQEAHLDRTCP